MHKLKLFGVTLIEFAKRLAGSFRRSSVQVKTNASESERLDRIRNPSKYLDRVNEKPATK